MSCLQQVGASQLFPAEAFHVQHLAELFGAERKEGFEGDGEVCHQLQGNVQDGCHTVHVGLRQLPRFGVGQVFVADACQIHGLLLCIAELECIEQLFHLNLHVGKLPESFLVVVGQFAAGRNLSFKIFVGEHQRTVHEVAVYGHQFVVVACLEVLPCKVVVFRFRRVGGEHIAQHVLLSGEILKVFVQPYRPVA